jgi:hypothetical protein
MDALVVWGVVCILGLFLSYPISCAILSMLYLMLIPNTTTS